MKRAYWVFDLGNDDTMGFVYIARNPKHAKKMFWKSGDVYGDWIDMRVRLCNPQKDASDLEFGLVDTMIGLERGFYGWVYGDCPICKEKNVSLYNEGLVGCAECTDA